MSNTEQRAEPTLKRTGVLIKYKSSDDYRSETAFQSHPFGKPANEPHQVFIDAIDELARLCELFGFGDEASVAVEGARQRVRAWRNSKDDI